MLRGSTLQKSRLDKGQLIAVAVDADKSSQHALKWAADHIISKSKSFMLLHVRKKVNFFSTPTGKQLAVSEVDDDVATTILEQINLQTRELLLPFRCFCSKRGLQCNEVILDGTDVPKVIAEFVQQQSVDKLVVGASSRGALARAFKHADVPTSLSKLVPDFCSVYIIAKGKISSVRPATRPNKSLLKKQQSGKYESSGNSFESDKSDPVPVHHVEDVSLETVDFHIHSLMVRSARNAQNADGAAGGLGYDNKANEKLHKVGQGGGRPDFSFESEGSCPSPCPSSSTDRSIDQLFGYSPRDNIDFRGRQRLAARSGSSCCSPNQSSTDHRVGYFARDNIDIRCRLSRSSMQNESPYSDDQRGNFESSRSGGRYWSNGSGSSGYGVMPSSNSQDFGGASWSSQSVDDVDADMKSVKLELQRIADFCNAASTEKSNQIEKGSDAYSFQCEYDMQNGARYSDTSVGSAEGKPWTKKSVETAPTKTMKKSRADRRQAEGKYLLQEEENWKIIEKLSVGYRYRRYTPEDIEKVTDKFSEKLKIGEGGYGPVFKSTLDHTVVAVKILRSDATQGMKQFQQEIEVLSCIRHPNMVLLMGACPEYGCLVYEYMANGSLEDCLFCHNGRPPLSWQLRFKIAAEIATGLLFLHETKPEPLVHRDLKPGNILLDHNFVSKISDVGLARLIPPAVADAITQYRMTAAAGTFCYIDPEYQQTGLLGIKSDIYALGIILLQLLTAAPPMGLAHNVEMALELGKFERMLDPTVPDWPMEQTMTFVRLALSCAELRRKDRPDLGTVVLPELNYLREFAQQSHTRMWNYQCGSIPGNQEVTPSDGCPWAPDDDGEDSGGDGGKDDVIKSPFMR